MGIQFGFVIGSRCVWIGRVCGRDVIDAHFANGQLTNYSQFVDRSNPIHLIRRKYRGYKNRALQWFCRRMVSLSIWQARRIIGKKRPLKILIDNSTLFHAVTHETAWVDVGTQLWGGRIPIRAGHAARVPVHSIHNDSRTYNEVQFLIGVAELERQGYIELYTSAELEAEKFRQPMGRFRGYGWFDYHLFGKAKIRRLDKLHIDLVPDPTAAQLARVNACTDPLFTSLVSVLGKKSNLDAFHVFTAERYSMDYFLHIDFPLADKIRQHEKKPPVNSMKCKVALPSMLGKQLKLLPIHTVIVSNFDSSWPVQTDAHLPSQQRQKRTK